jgi:aspartyl-tRNA(Asn)/glutamyl-tRNA(Gln) amidotransferase subunit A
MSKLSAHKNTVTELTSAVSSGEISVEEIIKFYSDRVDKHNDSINALLWWNKKFVDQELPQVKTRIAHAKKRGKVLPLAGIPVVIKDNIVTKGLPTTCGSKILENFVSVYDATVINKLRDAGAVIFAKANCDEFAMGSSTENSAYGAVKNPWDKSRVPGGSSGGSAASVAADLSPASLGSDTGGSIRQPASLCGIVGLKPTYGRISRYGLVAYGSSLDQIGPFSRTVKDSAIIYDVLSGHDPKDSTSLALPAATTTQAIDSLKADQASPLKGMRFGVVKEFFQEGLEADVRSTLETAIKKIKDLGGEVKEVSLPYLKYSISTYYVIATAEASANLARFDGIRYGLRAAELSDNLSDLYKKTRNQGFGREVKQRIILGTFVLSSGYYDAYYGKALAARRLISQDFNNAFKQVDLLISPTSPMTAFKIGEKADDPMSMYLADICTLAVNLAGLPALSMPAGFDGKGLPVGIQFIAPRLQEESLLKGAHIYERATNWWNNRSPSL